MRSLLLALAFVMFSVTMHAEQVNIDILSVNDFHGALVNDGKNPGIARIAGVIDDLRADNPNGTVVLSAGDMFQGSMESNMLRGMSVVEQMNYIGFDAACVGNHEFDWGRDILARNVRASKFPWLGANVIDVATGVTLAPLKPYAIIERQGVKIGIIGLCTESTPQATNPKNVEGIYFGRTMLSTAYYLDELKNQGVDFVILLTHLGGSQSGDEPNGEFEQAADLVKGNQVAAIITGHTHTYFSGKYDGVMIVQAGEYGRAIGKLSFCYDKAARKIVDSSETLIKLNDKPWSEVAPDAESQRLLNVSLREIASLRDETIAVAAKPLTHNPTRLRPTIFGEYMCDAVRVAAQADICLLSSGSIRKGLPTGAISYGNFYETMPVDITMYTLNMYGRDIKKVLEFGINHPSINIVQWSGFTVVYDARKAYGNGVDKIVMPDGTLLNPNARYRVVTSDFMNNGGGGFVMNGINGVDSGVLCRDVVKNRMVMQRQIDFCGDGRFLLIKDDFSMETPIG